MKNISSLSHSTERSLGEWLSYLENIHPTEIELGLARIGGVVKLLNIDFSFAKVITVAGTNGKGTTCAFLENALLAEGKSVAVYSSPHIEKFNERLRINKQDIDDQSIIDAFKKIIDKIGIPKQVYSDREGGFTSTEGKQMMNIVQNTTYFRKLGSLDRTI